MTLFPRGVFSAAATPLAADLSPDVEQAARHCADLIAQGCHGIALLGSTGEANLFSVAERKAILEGIVARGIAPSQLLPGVGVCALPETVELTRHALSCGVETVVMLPPFYYKGVPDQGLVDAFSYVIDQVADPRLKVVLYHIPPIAQVPITFPVIEALLKRYPETLVGMKDSSGDIEHMGRLIASFPNLSILAGADPFLLPLLGKGGGGCITATSNLVASDLRIVFDHHADSAKAKEVEAAQARIVGTRTIGNRFAQIPTIKAMLARRTGHDGWCRVRPPLVALTADERAVLGGLLAAFEASETVPAA